MITGEQIRMETSGKRRPYCELGKMLDALARERKVRGPYNIAQQIHNAAGFEVSGQRSPGTCSGSIHPSAKS